MASSDTEALLGGGKPGGSEASTRPASKETAFIGEDSEAPSWPENYSLFLRLRVTLFGLAHVVLLTGLVGGGFAQEYAEALLSERFNTVAVWMLTCIGPVLFTAFAVCIDGAFDMMLDTNNHPPLAHFRGVYLDMGVPVHVSDAVILVLMEVLPLIWIVFGLALDWMKFGVAPNTIAAIPDYYIRGSLLGTVIIAILCVVGRIYAKIRLMKCPEPAIQFVGLSLYKMWNPSAQFLPQPGLTSNLVNDQKPGSAHHVDWKKVGVTWLGSVAAFVALALITQLVDPMLRSGWGRAVAMFFVIAIFWAQRAVAFLIDEGRTILGKGYLFIVALVSIVWVVETGLYVSRSSIDSSRMYGDDSSPVIIAPRDPSKGFECPGASGSANETKETYYCEPGKTAKYAVCSSRWGADKSTSEEDKLTVVDMVMFNYAMQIQSPTLPDFLEDAFNGTVLQGVEPISREGVEGRPSYDLSSCDLALLRGFKIPRVKTVVFAIRGTATGLDVLTDVRLYARVAVMQSMKKFIPVFSFLPTSTIQFTIERLAPARWAGVPPPGTSIEEKILDEVAKIKSNPETHDYSFVITGHSLGSGLAGIISTRTGIPGVGFSGPGQRYSQRMFNITNRQIKHSFVNVVSDYDPVPMIDSQSTMTQSIECRVAGSQSFLGVGCHMLPKTACELFQSCEDARGRTWSYGTDDCGALPR